MGKGSKEREIPLGVTARWTAWRAKSCINLYGSWTAGSLAAGRLSLTSGKV